MVLTHGHPDHLGGLSIEGRPRFPAARHVMSRVEWDWLAEGDSPILVHRSLDELEDPRFLDRVQLRACSIRIG